MGLVRTLRTNLWPGGYGCWFVAVIIVAYYFVREPILLHSSRVPDEIWYLQLARERVPSGTVSELFQAFAGETNRLGYGALYWNLYSAMVFVSRKDAMFSMRILSLSFTALTGWSIYVAGIRRQNRFAALAAVLWLALPAAWWSGKITGPEMMSVFFATAGVAVLSGHPGVGGRLTAFVFIGLSIGVKLNAAPMAVFALLLLPLRPVRAVAEAVSALALGFVAANPSVVWNPGGYFAELAKMTLPPKHTWAFVERVFSNSTWEWDGVLSGGLLQWSFPIFGWALLLAVWLYFRIEKRFMAAASAAFVVWTILFLQNGQFLGWYWFPCVPLIPLSLVYLRRQEESHWRRAVAVVLLGALAAPLSISQQQHALWRSRNVDAMPSVLSCVQQLAAGRGVGQVVDYTEIYEADFRTLEPKFYEPGRVVAGSQSYTWLTKYPRRAFPGSTLVLVGDRLRSVKNLEQVERVLSDRKATMGYGDAAVIGQCAFVTVIEMK